MNTVRAKRPAPLLLLWQVYPQVVDVTARSGNQNYLLLVRRGRCRDVHQQRAPLTFEHGKRKAACGLGQYILLVTAKQAAA